MTDISPTADEPGIEPIQTPTLWGDEQWTARIIKNEDDDGWAVAMTRHGDPERLAWINTIFMLMRNNVESEAAARLFATRCGFKVRILRWSEDTPRDTDISRLAAEDHVRRRHRAEPGRQPAIRRRHVLG